jgi:hypothetical protein
MKPGVILPIVLFLTLSLGGLAFTTWEVASKKVLDRGGSLDNPWLKKIDDPKMFWLTIFAHYFLAVAISILTAYFFRDLFRIYKSTLTSSLTLRSTRTQPQAARSFALVIQSLRHC